MTTKKFIELLGFNAFDCVIAGNKTVYVNINGHILCAVEIHSYDYAIAINSDATLKDIDLDERHELGRLVIEYATTPLEKRGER